jgi:intracellular sulfur oxidation DsrE/DsrF family protein
LALLVLLSTAPLHAQAIGEPSTGPVVPDFGPVFEVEGMEVPVDTEREYRVVFDIAQSPAGIEGPNRYIESVARFLNMHARAGVPRERMHVAVVLHGPAGEDALRPGPYRERYDAENPNVELIRQLGEAGVDFYICGQSAMSRGLHDEELMPEIQMALSAMTARAMLQAEGYEVVN